MNSTDTPVYIDVIPEKYAIYDECFNNVKAKISRDGGAIQHGWIIWEWPETLIEAEFHAVWISPNGELRDITPKQDKEQSILFLPDKQKTYSGNRIDNIRKPLKNDQMVIDFIKVSEKITQAIEDNDIEKLFRLTKRQKAIITRLKKVTVRVGRNDKCSCGSGLKYKRCCGQA